MLRRVLRRLTLLRREGRPAAIAVIVASRGSVPARPGSAMLVEPDGATTGTVGGAELEWRARELALQSLRDGPKRETFTLWSRSSEGLDLECGGTVDVWAGPADLAPDRTEWEVAPGVRVRVESAPRVLLCGGGHIHHELSLIASRHDWDVIVVDERAEYRSESRFPDTLARHERLPDPAGVTHASIAGHRPGFELDCLDAVVRAGVPWIGLIASKAKRKSFYDALAARGVPADSLARVESPIGMPIGAVTPAEIAVAIAGSVIRTLRAGGSAAL